MNSTMKRACGLVVATIGIFFTAHSMHRGIVTRTAAKKHVHSVQQIRVPSSTPIKKQDVQTMLSVADCYFETTPGYPDVKKKLYAALKNDNQNALKGYLFEVETARELRINRGQNIRAFHKKCAHPQYMYVREFDIVTDICAYECKNVGWPAIDASMYLTAQLATQFAEQAELVRSGTVDVRYFMVCSKNPIPFHWQVWFMQQSILYMEGPA